MSSCGVRDRRAACIDDTFRAFIEPVRSILLHFRFGAERHAKTGRMNHRQIVRAVANRNGLRHIDAHPRGPRAQRFQLRILRDDIAQHVSRQPAIGSLQTVRNPIIEMRIGRETVHNLVKTTGDHADLPIMRVKRVNQFKRAMREMHAMVDLIENRGRQTLQ